MQLVEHDPPERAEQERRVVGGQQQRELLRRGQQDIRRIAPLPLPPRHRRIAGAGFHLDRQPHLGDRRFEIAGDIDRQRLQRRDIEGMEALAGRATCSRHEAGCRAQFHQRRQEPGQRLAGAGGGDQQRRAAGTGLRQQCKLMGARRPAAAGEPARKNLRQIGRIGAFRGHGVEFRQSSPCPATSKAAGVTRIRQTRTSSSDTFRPSSEMDAK